MPASLLKFPKLQQAANPRRSSLLFPQTSFSDACSFTLNIQTTLTTACVSRTINGVAAQSRTDAPQKQKHAITGGG